MSWLVYILRCGDGSLYTGCTNDLSRRLEAHQRGKGAKYTRSRLPVTLAYQEAAPDRSAALRREAAIKRLTKQQKLAMIEKEERVIMTEMRRKERQMPEEFAWEVRVRLPGYDSGGRQSLRAAGDHRPGRAGNLLSQCSGGAEGGVPAAFSQGLSLLCGGYPGAAGEVHYTV